MEPAANFHHHHQQQQDHHHQLLHHVDSSFSNWSSNPISSRVNGTTTNCNNINFSRNLVDTDNYSMLHQDSLGLISYIGTTGMGYPPLDNNYVTRELQRLARIKDEFSVADDQLFMSYHPKFLDLSNCSPTASSIQMSCSSYSNNNQLFQNITNDQGNSCSNGTISPNFPTTTTTASSSSSSSSSAITSISPNFDMNCLPALDLIGSPQFDGRHLNHHSSSLLNAYNNNLSGRSNYGFDHRTHPAAVCPNKISSPAVSNTGIISRDESRNKRPAAAAAASKYINAKATQTVRPLKKPKSEPRSSAAPFQVRKEKLGDRIAAIQQLVSPFGKTDTASVLTEAIGYIKFLQTQIETLSVPYMKSTRQPERWQMEDIGNTAGKRDLSSRGLCLVPLSCLSYVTDDHGLCEGLWTTP